MQVHEEDEAKFEEHKQKIVPIGLIRLSPTGSFFLRTRSGPIIAVMSSLRIISDTPFSGTHTYSDEQQQLPMKAKGFRLHRLQSYTRGDTDSRNLFRKFLDC